MLGSVRETITICYDDQCKLCQNRVNWVIRRDKRSRIKLEPLENPSDSVILTDQKGSWTESTAVIRTLAHLGGVWRLARVFYLVPAPLRNAAYRVVSRRRRRLPTSHEATQNTGE